MTHALPPQTSPTGSSTPFWQLLLIWLLAPALVLTAGLARFEWRYQDRIYPGIQAMGVDLSGLTREEAIAALQVAVSSYDLPPLALRYGDRVWPLKSEELGVTVDIRAMANEAFAYGRDGDFLHNLKAQWQAFWQGRQQSPTLEARPGDIALAIAQRTAYLNRPVSEPRLSLNDLQVVVSPSRPGKWVDIQATKAEVLRRVRSGEGGVVDVVVHEVEPAEADVSVGRQAMEQALDRSIVLADARGEFQFALDPAALSSLLDWVPDSDAPGGVRPEIREEPLRALVESWAKQIERPPLNARFDFDPQTGTLIELSPSVDGYALDIDATLAAIQDAITNGRSQVTLPVQIIRPAVPSDDPASLGIKELVAEGSTKFKGSSAARVKNIQVAASKFVGVVIPPGGIFSFNEYVGDVTAANGFEDSLIISGNSTAVGVGGGVCQVSTTVFRAAWFGGFPLVERWNHGYVVSWYGAPGLDATIYTPNVDFKFRNTTEHHLLIKPIVDTQKGILTFQFYGTKPNWTVETTKPKYSNRVPPPPPLYVEDPDLPKGKVVQFDWPVEGLDAEVSRRVIAADGTVLIDETLKSHYLPWQAKYRFGPGVTPPANAEVVWAKDQ
ncbi:MAG: hypothetical protein D6775_00365 [Caldilineae bacterium]|nr:MAG: hypothetical protein D6775_00365 [Caldilineae bacterium]